MADNPYEPPLTTAEKQKVRRFLDPSICFGLFVPAGWILLATLMSMAWNDAVQGGSPVPWGILVLAFWAIFGILQAVGICLMYRAGSRFWLSITAVSIFVQGITTLLMLG